MGLGPRQQPGYALEVDVHAALMGDAEVDDGVKSMSAVPGASTRVCCERRLTRYDRPAHCRLQDDAEPSRKNSIAIARST